MTKAVALLLVLLCGAPAHAETVRIARQYGISYLPLILMQDRHLLEAEAHARGVDVDVQWLTFTGGAPINDALISDGIDLAAGGVAPMLTLWAKTRSSLRVRGVAALGNMPIWLNSTNPAVQSVADLGPRDRIALPGVKVSIQAVVLQMAARAAFGPGNETRLDPLTVSMGHPDGETALLGGGEVTAHFTAAPFMYEELANPKVHRILDSYAVLGGPHSFNVVWTTTRYHDAHPAIMAAFMAALDQAMAIIHDTPDEAAATWVRIEHARLTPQQAAEMIRSPENEWTTTPTKIMDILAFMNTTGAISRRPDTWKDLFFPAIHAAPGS